MNAVTEQYALSTAFRRWGLHPKRTGTEFHSPCPFCGGTDRFVIFLKDGGYWCRPGPGHCGKKGWLDDDAIAPPKRPDNTLTEQLRREERDAKLRVWQEGYRVGYWRGWHDAMQQIHRDWWHSQGIPDWAIDYYGLGYCAEKEIRIDNKKYILPAYTIPCRDPIKWEVVNVQYRLVEPPPGCGKYRYEAGLPCASFYVEQLPSEPGACIVVEGAKKAIVVYEFLQRRPFVVGLSGNTPPDYALEPLKAFRAIWLVLDPGANSAAHRIAGLLKGQNVRIATLPMKPDDAFLAGMTPEEFRAFLECAR